MKVCRMYKLIFYLLVLFIMVFEMNGISSASDRGVIPSDGFVPTTEVAAAVAEAVLIPIYGEKNITNQKPFEVALNGDVWVIKGTVQDTPNTIRLGGVFTIKISRITGEILYLIHTR